MKIVNTTEAPVPGGHYSQAIIHQRLVYISGQLPFDPRTGAKVLGSIEDQARQVLRNLRAILEAAGSGLQHVIKTTIYLSDIRDWDRVNQIYAEFFGDHRPARSIVPVGTLHHGFSIEIEAVAEIAAQ
ncbi:MAG: Rid family detoxifying hydrolase [candidate division KSB1 bacterium]|nr:Rid family detoxifying hydrolase [candidate division KSB1 bacterium]MDZ7356986.1 Rid family detoxifying hydrolase [candidate division KSB1 bacterium]MDZ7400952.1 Rid family detoxifying hydrolase [candidate division KSB1 bacterium]